MEENQTLFSLSIDPVAKADLKDIAWWARFLGIAGIVCLALGLVVTLVDLAFMNDSMGLIIIVNGDQNMEVTPAMRIAAAFSAFIFAAVMVFPFYLLLQFSDKLKKALSANQQTLLNQAFKDLKKYFRYFGIIILLGIALIAIMVFLVISGSVL